MKKEIKPTTETKDGGTIAGDIVAKTKTSKKSAKITVDEEVMLDAQTAKLKEIIKEVTESKTIAPNIIEALKDVQAQAGTAGSQAILDKLIALQRAKQEGKLEEFIAKETSKSTERGKAVRELTGLTLEQKKAMHRFMKDVIKCDEYICIALTEYNNGLQTEVLTQLRPHVVQAVLDEIITSIGKGEGEEISMKD